MSPTHPFPAFAVSFQVRGKGSKFVTLVLRRSGLSWASRSWGAGIAARKVSNLVTLRCVMRKVSNLVTL